MNYGYPYVVPVRVKGSGSTALGDGIVAHRNSICAVSTLCDVVIQVNRYKDPLARGCCEVPGPDLTDCIVGQFQPRTKVAPNCTGYSWAVIAESQRS